MSMEIPGIINSGLPPDLKIKEGTRRAEERINREIETFLKKNKSIKSEEIKLAIDKLAKSSSIFNKRVKIYVNKEINRIVVKVIDTTTDKVIKEIPPEEIQHLIAKIRETLGVLIDEKR